MATKYESPNPSNSRQKIIAIALIIVIGFLIWQVMGLFGNSANEAAPVANGSSTAANDVGGKSPSSSPDAVPAPIAVGTPPELSIPQTSQTNTSELMNLQKVSEVRILESLNTLQMLRVQREIAETSQAIASAKLATVTAEKNISDLLTRPAPPQVPVSSYSDALANPSPQPVATAPSRENNPSEAQVPIDNYVLLSVSMQFNRWYAVIGSGGKLFNVSVGDVLSPDGSIVTSINKDSVILEKDGKAKKLTIVSSI